MSMTPRARSSTSRGRRGGWRGREETGKQAAQSEPRRETPADPTEGGTRQPEAKADNGKDSLAKNKAKSPDAADQPTADKAGDSGSTLRSNFSETAFFVPQLLTETDGSAAIEFTVPDSVTSWNVWVHALTQDLSGASERREVRTVKELMVRPYLPRFFREADSADLKVMVNNAGDKPLKGKLLLEILDPETQQVILSEPSSKLDEAMTRIETLIDEQKKVVVFAVSRQLIQLLNARLEKAKVKYVTIHGEIPQMQRGPAVTQFQTDPKTMVFTGTIAAGGTGITLTAAHHLIFLQRDWSPANNQQAISRLDRIGQNSPVSITDIVTRDTVEIKKNATAERKWSWIQKLLGDI